MMFGMITPLKVDYVTPVSCWRGRPVFMLFHFKEEPSIWTIIDKHTVRKNIHSN